MRAFLAVSVAVLALGTVGALNCVQDDSGDIDEAAEESAVPTATACEDSDHDRCAWATVVDGNSFETIYKCTKSGSLVADLGFSFAEDKAYMTDTAEDGTITRLCICEGSGCNNDMLACVDGWDDDDDGAAQAASAALLLVASLGAAAAMAKMFQ